MTFLDPLDLYNTEHAVPRYLETRQTQQSQARPDLAGRPCFLSHNVLVHIITKQPLAADRYTTRIETKGETVVDGTRSFFSKIYISPYIGVVGLLEYVSISACKSRLVRPCAAIPVAIVVLNWGSAGTIT